MIYDKNALNNGLIFQRTVDILNKQMNQGIKLILEGQTGKDGSAKLDAALLVSVVTNCSFACELYMKSMLPPGTSGHNLDKLFSTLDIEIQKRIKQYTINNISKSNPTYCDKDFQNDLIQNKNVFAEWRYFHEKRSTSVNTVFLSSFMGALHEVAMADYKTR